MADNQFITPTPAQPWQHSVEEARELAKARFKERLEKGEQVGDCSCHTEHEAVTALGGDSARVLGVRFRDSSRIYFYAADDHELAFGDWVVVPSSRGIEAARVVIAPRQMMVNQLDGDPHPIERILSSADVEAMESRRDRTSELVRTAANLVRERNARIKIVTAEFNFDGSQIQISFSGNEQSGRYVDQLTAELSDLLGANVRMVQVGPRDEARLLGGLGKCGRTLCCSAWLPYYPDVSMNMAKTQDLSLNPSKVTGLCGRLLCCLSYENDQYRQAKRILPRLGNTVATADGNATVISLQVLKELVTVRLEGTGEVRTIPAADVLGEPDQRQSPGRTADGSTADQADDRRKRRTRRSSSASQE